MATQNASKKRDPKIIDVLKTDIRRGDFGRSVKKDYLELKEFMLDDDRRARLKEMRTIKKWFYFSWWLMKSLFFKLNPTRRLILVIGLLFFFFSQDIKYETHQIQLSINPGLLGMLVLLFVLMLELKDKLLAHEELEAGHAVQNALMPEESPIVQGWTLWLFTRSANEVGGDLVDFMRISETKYSVTLADVAGKGLSAALLTAKLLATVRALAPDVPSLAELGNKLNKIFVRDSLPNLFASLVHVEFTPDSGSARLINAGHLPPIIVRGNEIRQLEKGGTALGLTSSAQFQEQEVEMRSGDVLFIYSDGLTEARNNQGEFWGDQRLLSLLPVMRPLPIEQIGENILWNVDSFINGAKAHDDISIAIIKRN